MRARTFALFFLTVSITFLPFSVFAYGDCPRPGTTFPEPVNTTQVNNPIFVRDIWMDENETYTLETKNLQPISADTVLRIATTDQFSDSLMEWSDGEYARDDDGGNETYASKISNFQPPTSGYYRVIIHNYSSSGKGTATLRVEDSSSYYELNNIPFGGTYHYPCVFGKGDELNSVYEVGDAGADLHQILLVDSAPGPLQGYAGNPDPDANPNADSSADWHTGAHFHFDEEWSGIVLVGSYNLDDTGKTITTIWNDKTTETQQETSADFVDGTADADGDGLGDDIEAVLDTCIDSSDVLTNGFDCSGTHPSDTDGDGLSDFAEVVGYRGDLLLDTDNCAAPTSEPYFCDKIESLPLRWWGADPLHQDVFVEVDYDGNDAYADGDGNGFPDKNLRQDFDQSWAGKMADLFSHSNKANVQNPDGTTGINIHYDVQDLNNAGGKLKDGNGDVIGPIDDGANKRVVFDGGGSGVTNGGQTCGLNSHKARRQDSQTTLRTQTFHYACVETFSNSANAQGRADVTGLSMSILPNDQTAAHELGHNLGLYHGGDSKINGKPNYHSLMNYPFDNVVYGRSGIDFSDGVVPTVNPTELYEGYGLGPNEDVELLARKTSNPPNNKCLSQPNQCLTVDIGDRNVDWNRTESFETEGNPVRAAVTWAPGHRAGTKAHIRGWDVVETVSSAATPSNTPTLARTMADGKERLYVIYPTGQNSSIRYYKTGFAGDCPNPAIPGDEFFCGNWNGQYNTALNATHLTAATEPPIGGDIWLAINKGPDFGDNLMLAEGLAQEGGTMNFSKIEDFPNEIPVGTPDIHLFGDKFFVVWRDKTSSESNSLRQIIYDPATGSYSGPTDAPADGTLRSSTSVTLADGYMLRANPKQDGNLDIMKWNGEIWEDSTEYDLPITGYYETNAKPGFVWHPYDMVDNPTLPGAGFWMIAHRRRNHRNQATGLAYFDGDAANPSNFGEVRGEFFSHSNFSNPVEFLFYPPDDNIHATVFRSGSSQNIAEFYPYADGIFDVDLKDYDDFELMARGICGAFKDTGNYPDADPFDRNCGPSGALQPPYNQGEYR